MSGGRRTSYLLRVLISIIVGAVTTQAQLITNGSFENIGNTNIPKQGWVLANPSQVPGWNTLLGQKIEVWDGNAMGIPAADGSQFIELDVTGSARDGLYQDVPTTAGDLSLIHI